MSRSVRRIQAGDVEAVAVAMSRLNASFGGLHGLGLWRTIAEDSVEHRLTGVVAHIDGECAGAAFSGRPAYGKEMLLRYPGLLFRFVLSRFQHHATRKAPGGVYEGELTEPAPVTWQAPGEAERAIFVGVLPKFREIGIAAALCDERRHVAGKPILARIAVDNVASIRLHTRRGWKVWLDGDGHNVLAYQP
jgi:hypothetical protein